MSAESKMLTPSQLAGRLGVHKATLARWRMRGCGPAFIKVGHAVRYHTADVDAWLLSCSHESTATYTPETTR